MTLKQYKKIAKLIKDMHSELESLAIEQGIELDSHDYNVMYDNMKEKLLSGMGYTMDEYAKAQAKYELQGEMGKAGHTPTEEELLNLIRPLIPDVQDGHTPTDAELLNLIKPLIPKVKDGQTPSDERLVELMRPLIPKIDEQTILEELSGIKKKVEDFKIPEPVDLGVLTETIKTQVETDFGKTLKKNIDVLGMPDFRKLAMGLQQQIDDINTATSGDGHVIKNNGTSLTQRNALNFSPPLEATDNGALDRTDIGILNDGITFAMIQNITDNRLLGRSVGSSGDMMEITVGSGLSLAAGALTATGSGGTVTSVASADASIIVTNPTTTVDLAVVSAPKLTTARTIGGTSFDGTANIVPGLATTVTTNADLTGVVTSSGNATAIADAALSIAKTSGLQTALDLKAPLASPTFTGTVTVPTPSNDTDASTKAYVDAVAQGLSVKGSVLLATAAALPANTYLAGVITITATGTLTVDGTVTALNDRILVKDEVAALGNGIYKVTTAGAVGVAAVLTRSTDMDIAAEFPGAFVFVETGTVNAAAGFVCTNSTPPTVGTTAINFTQFSGAGEITAGAGMTKSGNTLNVIGTANRITVGADAVDIGTDVVTLTGSQALTNKTYNGNTFTAGTGVLTIAASKTLTASNTLTLAGTDGKGIDVGAATSGKILIGDGSNMVLSTSTIPTSAGATAGKILVSDGTNYVLSTPTFPNASATSGKMIKSDGTNWVASTETYAAPGTSGNVMTSDGTNWTSAASSGGGVLSTTVNISSANILAMNATPVSVIAGVAGQCIQLLGIMGQFTHGTQYTGGGNVTLREETSNTIFTSTLFTGTNINAASDTIAFTPLATGQSVMVSGKGLFISNATGAFLTGTGTIKLYITYRMVTL